MSKTKLSIKEQIRRAQQSGGGHPTKTVTVWLGADLDLVAEYENAVKALENPPKAKRLGDDPMTALRSRADELHEQLDAYRIEWKIRGLDWRRWEALTAKHPPRKTDDGGVDPRDRAGWNAETLAPAVIRAATVSPKCDDDDWLFLLGDEDTEGALTASQVDYLALQVHNLTHTPVDVPFWSAASPTTQTS